MSKLSNRRKGPFSSSHWSHCQSDVCAKEHCADNASEEDLRKQAAKPLSHSQLQDFTKINLRSRIESKSKYRDISDIEINFYQCFICISSFHSARSLRKSFEKWKASLRSIYQCALSVWSCAPALVTSRLHKGKLFLKSSHPKDTNPKASTSRTKYTSWRTKLRPQRSCFAFK